MPVDLACQVAGVWLHADESLDDRTTLSPDEVLRLLRFCLDATFVAYQREWYQKTFGTAMGSPVSVTVANLVMEDVEERALASYPTPPPFWKRFVDDTCMAIPPPPPPPPPDHLESFHSHLNSIEPSIDFTYELEEQEKLPFLDLLIKHHPDGTLSTTVYRKKTHTDKYTPPSPSGPSCARSPWCTFARKRHDSLHLGVAPVDGVSCVYCMFCNNRSLRTGIRQCCSVLFNLVLSDLLVCPT